MTTQKKKIKKRNIEKKETQRRRDSEPEASEEVDRLLCRVRRSASTRSLAMAATEIHRRHHRTGNWLRCEVEVEVEGKAVRHCSVVEMEVLE